jgi:selenocysteine-specific elongation factor
MVAGVIGHVDHGKTALVRALTGMETDRLAEEQRRGISIALGFAHFSTDGSVIDLIDMPGHERFVRTMISGATGIDAVLLIVAANEGIKPQTIEHVDIAVLLGVRRAVIAVSKADLVSEHEAVEVARQASAFAARVGLVTAPPILTSATTGQGVLALKQALARAVREGAAPEDDGFPYLPVDRAFSVAGYGTVVTGTLRRGPLAVGDELAVVPGGLAVRVRSLQVHGAAVRAASPGQRVAVNLRGVEPAQVPRGTALTARGLLAPSAWLSVELRAVAGGPALRTNARLALLLGTSEVEARLRLLDRDTLEPGETALAQLQCAEPVAPPARERFILRTLSPPMTVGGGRVLESATARRRRHAPDVLAHLAALANADPARMVADEVARAGAAGARLDALARLAGVAPARVAAMLGDASLVIGRSGVAVAQAALDGVLAQIPGRLAASEPTHPDGLSRDQLAALLPEAAPAVLDEAIARLVARGVLLHTGGSLRIRREAREQDRAREEAALAVRLTETLRRGGLSPPDPAKLAPDPRTKRLLDRLVREGVAVRTLDRVQKREILFHREVVEAARRQLAPLLAKPPGLLTGEAGAALGISRKYSVPLLEYLDATGFTRRTGDRRMLARPAETG